MRKTIVVRPLGQLLGAPMLKSPTALIDTCAAHTLVLFCCVGTPSGPERDGGAAEGGKTDEGEALGAVLERLNRRLAAARPGSSEPAILAADGVEVRWD